MQTNTGILRLFDLLSYCSYHYSGKVAFCSRKGNEWIKTTFDDYQQKADQVSLALLEAGINKGDNIITISRNRAEFNFVDMGIMQTGAVHVPLYATIDDSKLNAIVKETESPVIFTGNDKIHKRVKALQESVQTLKQVICFDDIPDGETFTLFLKKAEQQPRYEMLQKIKNKIKSSDHASITYISGSTTEVKGIIHSHADHIHNSLSIAKSTCITPDMNLLSLLPLAHSYERSINYCVQFIGATTWYNNNFKSIEQELNDIRPDVIFMVPFLMQKLYESLVAQILPENEPEKSGYQQAIRQAATYEAGERINGNQATDNLFFDKIRPYCRKFMGDNIKMLYCGGASLNQGLRRFFDNCGMTCYEGYGLTEAGPVVAHNNPLMHKAGTVGKPVADTIIKIADDGEVLVKSPSVLQGYFKHSSDISPVDDNGWLHTGDTGFLDSDGFLTLTGVKKRIFKLSTGIYADPLTIEQSIESLSVIRRAFVTGINQDYLTAIICPDFTFIRKEFQIPETLEPDNAALLDDKSVSGYLDIVMKEYNQLNRGSELQVKYFYVSESWDTENGLLNADNSLNRVALLNKYRSSLDILYSGSTRSR